MLRCYKFKLWKDKARIIGNLILKVSAYRDY